MRIKLFTTLVFGIYTCVLKDIFSTVIIDQIEHKSNLYTQEGGGVFIKHKRDHSLTLIRLIQTLNSLAS